MDTNIKIKDKSVVKNAAFHFGGYLDVWTKDGFRRYQARAAIKKIEKMYDTPKDVTFRIEMADGIIFTATANQTVFTQLVGDYKIGPQPGDFPIILSAKPPTSDAAKGWAAIFVVGGLLFWMFSGGTTDQPEAPSVVNKPITESGAQVMAAVLCEQRVEDLLHAPSTADFPFFSQAVYDGQRSATLSSYVDAQNGFGAMIRTRFVCTVEYTSGDPGDAGSWRIKDFVVLQ